MKDLKTKERFIELRAQGKSLAKIAKEIRISKQTGIKWQRDFEEEIARLKTVQMERLYEKYLMKKETTIRHFGLLLKKVRAELDKHDFSQFTLKQLLDLDISLTKRLQEEYEAPAYDTDAFEDEEFDREAAVKYFLKNGN